MRGQKNPMKWSDSNLQHEDKLQPNGGGLLLPQVGGGGTRDCGEGYGCVNSACKAGGHVIKQSLDLAISWKQTG